jgi:hypothetical protein
MNNSLQIGYFAGLPENPLPKQPAVNRSVGIFQVFPETRKNGLFSIFDNDMPEFVHVQDGQPPRFQKGGNMVFSGAI